MKKLFLFLSFMMATTSSCDPPLITWIWSVKNSTEQTLKIRFIPQTHQNSPAYGQYDTIIIPKDGNLTFYSITADANQYHASFSDYFRASTTMYGNDVYLQILSEDDVVLKTWNYSDADLFDRRFFDESAWHYKKGPGQGAFVIASYSWIFDILPEDIESTENQ